MVLGFTGTRKGLTDRQKLKLKIIFDKGVGSKLEDNKYVVNMVTSIHHGDCIGADKDAHDIAMTYKIDIIIHPPTNESKRAFCKKYTKIHMPYDYLVRNMHIVDSCEILVVCPCMDEEETRSGTWSTVRYARKIRRPLIIINPDNNKGYY